MPKKHPFFLSAHFFCFIFSLKKQVRSIFGTWLKTLLAIQALTKLYTRSILGATTLASVLKAGNQPG
jgi:hypothetical protein